MQFISEERCASFETPASPAPQDEERFLMPHPNTPHPEERLEEARLEGRGARIQRFDT